MQHHYMEATKQQAGDLIGPSIAIYSEDSSGVDCECCSLAELFLE
jgi:hypothetical protein